MYIRLIAPIIEILTDDNCDLDMVGSSKIFGIPRENGETDMRYRLRLIASLMPRNERAPA